MVISDVFNFFRGKKVVFIFDNLERITTVFKTVWKEIEKLELLGPIEIKPFVIITTRLQVLKSELPFNTKFLELEALTPTDALTFLARALDIRGHDQDSDLLELARRLQYFPLDLTQAVGYLHSKSSKSVKLSGTSFGVKQYIELFEKERKDLLDFHEMSHGRLSPCFESTYINWKVARESLAKHSQIGIVCIDLMSAISFFSPDGVSVPFLADITKLYLEKKPIGLVCRFMRFICKYLTSAKESVSDTFIDEAINLCGEYYLFSLKNGVIYVHRLVMEVIRIELANNGGLDKEVVSVLAECFEDKFMTKSLPENSIQHAVLVWEHISIDRQLVHKHKYFPIWVFDQLERDIKYSECTSFGSKAIEVLSSVLGDVEVTLHLMHRRCIVLVLNGKFEEAGIGYREVYGKRKALIGDEHKDTLASEYGIGLVLYFQREYVEALQILERVEAVQERVLGKEHSNTLQTKDRIASVLQKQGKFDEALLIYREINAIWERVLGKHHPDTLAGKNNMALVLYSQRKYEEALQIYCEVDEIKERVLGSEHPSTLKGKFNIAAAFHEKGENLKALSLLRDVYEKEKRVLGDDHPSSMNTKRLTDRVDAVVNKTQCSIS